MHLAPVVRHLARPAVRSDAVRSDAGQEAVGQALLITIGMAGMLIAARIVESTVGGMSAVIDALN
jgi:hypothetical protein